MLSNQVMGVLALAILWINTLLVAAAAAQEVIKLRLRQAELGVGLRRGRVLHGDGPGGALAVHRIDQVGRAGGDAEIHFSDRRAEGELFGGRIALDDGGEADVPARAPAEVWLGAEAIEQAGACPSAAAFAEAHAAARKAKGWSRTLAAVIGPGSPVFFSGRLVSSVDPRALLSRHVALAAAFIAGEILLAAGCTAVALWPPVFGRVSTVGGALCLGFFLLVQPAGTALRDAMAVPSRAAVRGRWTRSAAPATAETAA
jgi:hypothetical protein